MTNELDQEEEILRSYFKKVSFYEMACAIRTIIKKKLYKTSHGSLKEYFEDKWKMCKSAAYQFSNAADIIDNLKTHFDDLPQTESQVRALSTISPEEQVRIWRIILDTCHINNVTADVITRTIKDYKHGLVD